MQLIGGGVLLIVAMALLYTIMRWKRPRKGRAPHTGEFVRTLAQVMYKIEPVGAHSDVTTYDRTGFDYRKITRETITALIDDGIHLRSAHYSQVDSERHAYIYYSRCIYCGIMLPMMACFLTEHYYCLDCIKRRVLPAFSWERLLLLREMGLLPQELRLIIVKCVASLCFDHAQIHSCETDDYQQWIFCRPSPMGIAEIAKLREEVKSIEFL